MTVMSLKEQMAADISAVFLNPDEFAEMHDIDGNQVLALIEKDVLQERSSRKSERYDGIYKGAVTVYVKESDLGYRPVYGQSLHLDSELYLVTECYAGNGLLTVGLEANES